MLRYVVVPTPLQKRRATLVIPAASGLDQFVDQYVRKHYQDADSPLMLAELGKEIKDRGYIIPSGRSLKQYIEQSFGSALPIIQNPDVPASIAVTLPENKADVEPSLLSLSKSAGRSDDLERLPRALLIAFCRHLPPGRLCRLRPSSAGCCSASPVAA